MSAANNYASTSGSVEARRKTETPDARSIPQPASAQFLDAIRASGLTPPDTIFDDGKLRRFASNGKRGDDAGWYVFHANGIAAGCFGDWRSGFSETWRADIGRALTPTEESAHRAKADVMRKQREAEEAKAQERAANKAAAILKASAPAPADHPYLARKGIKPHGARVLDGRLVIPMRDAGGKLWNVERIASVKPADGTDKKGLYQGRRTGCYFSIGAITSAAALCIAEGFATGATIHEASGYPVAVAFNAGNLLPVATALREKFPELPLILCADDDYGTAGNPGLTKATEAARAVGGLTAIPDFGIDRPEGASDFNDMATARGLEAVRRAIANAAASVVDDAKPDGESVPAGDCEGRNEADVPATSDDGVTGVTGVQANSGAGLGVTPHGNQGVTGVTPEPAGPIPDETGRPAFRVFVEWVEHGGRKYPPGVWHFGMKAGKGDTPPTLTEVRVCSPLHIEAVTFDGQDNNFGPNDAAGEAVTASRGWHVHFPNLDPVEVIFVPDATRAEVAAIYPGAIIKPLPDPPRRQLTAAEAAELRSLVLSACERRGWGAGDIWEAKEAALADPDAALICWRTIAGEESFVHSHADDYRRRCEQCANLTGRGLCLAAWRGEIAAYRNYEPVSDIPRRCEGYAPGGDDRDQRPGRER